MARVVVHKTTGDGLPASKSSISIPWPQLERQCKGRGVVVQGQVRQIRSHSTYDGKDYCRFRAIVLQVASGRNRVFDPATGEEVDPEGKTQSKKRTGYMSWKDADKGGEHDLTAEQVAQRLGNIGLPKTWDDDVSRAGKRHPVERFVFEFWQPYADSSKEAVKVGDTVRLKTKGASHCVDTLYNLDSFTSNLTEGTSYAGEDLGDNWTDKILSPRKGPEPEPEEENSAVSDDEWD